MNQYPAQVVIQQPGFVSNAQTEWSTSMMSCCDDVGVCLCGCFFPICLGCQIAGDMGECCCCGTSVAMRTLIRTKYHIQGSICNDFCTHLFCFPCAVCQMKREINHQQRKGH